MFLINNLVPRRWVLFLISSNLSKKWVYCVLHMSPNFEVMLMKFCKSVYKIRTQ